MKPLNYHEAIYAKKTTGYNQPIVFLFFSGIFLLVSHRHILSVLNGILNQKLIEFANGKKTADQNNSKAENHSCKCFFILDSRVISVTAQVLEEEMEQVNVYGYMRVSTKEQKEDRQRIALLEMGIPEKQLYMDKLSGKDFDRPQYMQLLEKLDSGSVLFIKSIDRLGRNYQDLIEQWRIITKDKGADIVVIDMPILDTRREKNLLGTFISDIILSLLSYVAENERINIRQRQKEGIAAAKERGVKFGRPPIVLPDNFHELYAQWRGKRITLKEAAKTCNMAESTFFDKAKQLEKSYFSK